MNSTVTGRDREATAAGPAAPKGLIVVVSGPSGVGKTTVCRRLAHRMGAVLSVSATTRPRRHNEVDGRDYHFLTREEFNKRVTDADFVEHAEYDGHLYGTPARPLRQALAAGKVVLLDIDMQGGEQVRGLFDDAVLIFLTTPSKQELMDRLDRRHTDPQAARHRRLKRAEQEIRDARQSGLYRYFVTNDILENAVEQIRQIVDKEKQPK